MVAGHRSLYGLWRQVLEYLNAHLNGLTATPGKHTLGQTNPHPYFWNGSQLSAPPVGPSRSMAFATAREPADASPSTRLPFNVKRYTLPA